MLTNPRDAFRGQSRSPNIVPFHMLGIVSYQCAIVTLSVRRTVFEIFDFKKCRDLEIRVRGHIKSLKMSPFDREPINDFLLMFYSNYGSISCCSLRYSISRRCAPQSPKLQFLAPPQFVTVKLKTTTKQIAAVESEKNRKG